jgi:hypothetical protein
MGNTNGNVKQSYLMYRKVVINPYEIAGLME